MPVKICPRCNQRIVVDANNSDVVHECNSGNDTLDQEDVLVIGNWTDYTGSGVSKSKLMHAGLGNKAFGTRAGIQGEIIKDRTDRGNPKDIYRSRQHLEFIEFENGK